METITIVHLSDLHLARRPRQVDPLTLIGNVGSLPPDWNAAWVSSHHPGIMMDAARRASLLAPDLVVVSGDLATSGDPKDIAMADRVLHAIGQPAWPWLASIGGQLHATLAGAKNLAAIPGNHDRYQAAPLLAYFNPGSTACDAALKWPTGSRAVHIGQISKGREQLHLIGVDCTLAQGDGGTFPVLGHLAQGRVTKQALTDLRAIHAGLSPGAVAWIVHWPPEFAHCPTAHDLISENHLLTLARKMGISFFLSGHTHETRGYPTSVGVPVFCNGSTSQFVVTKGNALLEIEVDIAGASATARATPWEYDRRRAEFVRTNVLLP